MLALVDPGNSALAFGFNAPVFRGAQRTTAVGVAGIDIDNVAVIMRGFTEDTFSKRIQNPLFWRSWLLMGPARGNLLPYLLKDIQARIIFCAPLRIAKHRMRLVDQGSLPCLHPDRDDS